MGGGFSFRCESGFSLLPTLGRSFLLRVMDPSLDELPIHVIDFEGGPQCGIVEFGVVTLKGFSIVETSTRLCKPKAAISRKEEAVHGIGNACVKGVAPFADEWDRFASMRERGPLAAHFASAENSMLKAVFPYPRMSNNWIQSAGKTAEWGPWLDTGIMYRNHGDDGSSLKLEDLVSRWGLQRELDELAVKYCPSGRQRYHCALYDALASALLFLHYCAELSDVAPTLLQLVAESQGSAAKRQGVEQQNLF